MCQVCNTEGIDTFIKNGRRSMSTARFYRVYVGKVAQMGLCYYHSIKLFHLGERRFLRRYKGVALDIAKNQKNYSAFGFY
jgi:hypothetical protein